MPLLDGIGKNCSNSAPEFRTDYNESFPHFDALGSLFERIEDRCIRLNLVIGHTHHHQSQFELFQIMLAFQFAVYSHENIKLFLRTNQQWAIGAATPTHLAYRSNSVARKCSFHSGVNALV